MIPFPAHYDEKLQPLPAQQMSEAGAQALELLASKGYTVQAGLTPEYADAIHAMSQEPSIKEYCPKDSSKRFTNRQTTADWLSKKRATYLLLCKLDNGGLELAGYGWVGTKQSSQVPGGETTFSLRVGEGHQGRGLAAPFSVSMLAAATASYGAEHMWLETWASNGGAVHIYHKLGFSDVAETQEQRPSLVGGSVADTRIYMAKKDDEDNTKTA
jgi:ribosomal protein S18 acetylase RimI-like enzyme